MKRIFLIGLCVGINGIKSAENARVIPEIVITTPEEYELQKELAELHLLKAKLLALPNISSVSSRSSSGKGSSLYDRGASPFLTISEDEFFEGPLYTKKDLKEHEEKKAREEKIQRLKDSFNDVWTSKVLTQYAPRVVSTHGSRTVSTHSSRSTSADSSRSTSAAVSRPASTDVAQRGKSALFFLGFTPEEDEEVL